MESEEDEEVIIEKRRQQRLAIVQKYETLSTATSSKAASVVSSDHSDSDSDSSSDEDSDAVDRKATEDLEEDIQMVASQSGHGMTVMSKPSKETGSSQGNRNGRPQINDSPSVDKQSNNGDMFADGDMFSENYNVSFSVVKMCMKTTNLRSLLLGS